MERKDTKKLSRRAFLKASGAAATSALIAANVPVVAASTNAPTQKNSLARQNVDIVIMMNTGELSDAEVEQFNADYEGITLTRLETDTVRFYAMLAADEAPDILRVQAPQIPQLVARGIPLNLSPYFDASSVLSEDDLAPANNYYKADDAFNVGQGNIYGMVKDWSPDLTVWVNDNLFEAVGLEPPGDDAPITYEDVADLAQQVMVQEGDRVMVTGFSAHPDWIDRYWMTFLLGLGKSLYSDDFKSISLVDNDEAREAIKWHLDLAKTKAMLSPINPTVSWPGIDFAAGTLAMVQYGFWYSGGIEGYAETEDMIQAQQEGKLRMLPAPTWKGQRLSPTITATGSIVVSASKHPDEAWQAWEWYNAKEPAIGRAGSGWGVPALKSMFNLIPKEGVYREQVWKVLEGEIEYSGFVLPFNPYLPGGEPGVLASSFEANWEQYLLGDMDFDDLLYLMEDEVNFAIQDGIDRLS